MSWQQAAHMVAGLEAKISHLRCKQEAKRSFGNDKRLLKHLKSTPRDTSSNKVTPQTALSTKEQSVQKPKIGGYHIQTTTSCKEKANSFSYKKITNTLSMCLSKITFFLFWKMIYLFNFICTSVCLHICMCHIYAWHMRRP